jgi:hypothetical protein
MLAKGLAKRHSHIDQEAERLRESQKNREKHSKAQASLTTQAVLAQQKWLNNFIEQFESSAKPEPYSSHQMQASSYAKFLNSQAQPKQAAKDRCNSTMNYASAKAVKPGAKPGTPGNSGSTTQLKKHQSSLSKDRSLSLLVHAA